MTEVNGLHWAANALKASRWQILLARLFGTRVTGTDGVFTCVGYERKGIIYMVDFISPKDTK